MEVDGHILSMAYICRVGGEPHALGDIDAIISVPARVTYRAGAMTFMVGTEGAAPRTAVAPSTSFHATAANRDQAAGSFLAGSDASAIALALGKDITTSDDDISRVDTFGTIFLARADACCILAAVGIYCAARDGDIVDAAVLAAADAGTVAVDIFTFVVFVAVGIDDAACDSDVAAVTNKIVDAW